MLKRLYFIVYFLLVLQAVVAMQTDSCDVARKDIASASIDSILNHLIHLAPYYNDFINEYRADLYVKGDVFFKKRNHLVRFVPDMLKPRKGVNNYIVEAFSDLHFTAPNIYDRKVKAMSGTTSRFAGVGCDVFDYFSTNLFSPFLLKDKFLSPISSASRRYYVYKLDSVYLDKGRQTFRISFKPRNKNYRLVKGYMIVTDGVWSVRGMYISGRSEYLKFNNHIQMGEVGSDYELLPVRYDFNSTFTFMGSVVEASYVSLLEYRTINHKDDSDFFSFRSKKKYDLSSSYNLQTDTTAFTRDSTVFDRIRPIPLTDEEKQTYHSYHLQKQDDEVKKSSRRSAQFFGQLGDMLVSDYTINLSRVGSVKGSALINPFLMSYSGSNGISYKQVFKYNQLFSGDRLLRVSPRVGYNFKHHEFYWRLRGEFGYRPEKRSSIFLETGNGNRIYASDVLSEIKHTPDTLFNFNNLKLDYYRDFYIDLRHQIEIINGLKLETGVVSHYRKRTIKSHPSEDEEGNDDASTDRDLLRNHYSTIAPRVILSWTPGQYYYMNGKRKMNLYSRFPTFSIDWERGIKGALGTTGGYERIEADMQHTVSLTPFQTLYYRAGGGVFSDQDQVYFVDFVNFARNNLPTGWNDEIGGTFHLLDRRWYNASRKYLRANVTYEAPLILIPGLLKHAHYVINERLYFGVVTMPHLNPYIEVGYGIGTHIFDLGLFASFLDGKYEKVGFKVTFELFNR